MEPEQDDRLGLGYHQFRVVDRYRSCGYPDLRDPAAVPAGMAYGGQPCRGGHDDLCGDLRRAIPDLAYGPGVDGLFRDALSQYPGAGMGELQLSAVVGRICGIDLFHRILIVLVYGSAARSRGGAGPRQTEMEKILLWSNLLRMERIDQALA